MAEESHYSAEETATATATPNKRKYDDQPITARRPTGFSSPNSAAPPPSYTNVPPPADEIQMAKQKAQEIAARLLSGAAGGGAGGGGGGYPPVDNKRPRVDNGTSGFDSMDKGFSSASSGIVSYGSSMGAGSKTIDVPNGRVGVIIGKSGETIKYLQLQSGAKIQVTRDMDADPNSPTRKVELMGTHEQIEKAERLITDVLAEADAGGSGTVGRRFGGQGGSGDHFVMKVPNNKVGLVIGKGGETIKNMQARTGARIQVIPLHLPPGDTTSDRNVHIDGTSEQIEAAKQLVNEVISENRMRNSSTGGSYSQQGYQPRPPANWGTPGGAVQQPGYGYTQPGPYTGASGQYNMSQPPYGGYPPQSATGGYAAGWDQSTGSNQIASQGYDYYSQQTSQPPPPTSGGPAAADNSGYGYSQPQSGYNNQGQGYGQEGYGGYPQSGYAQPQSYDQQQGYTTAPSYGTTANPTEEGQNSSYGAQGDSAQAPPQPSSVGQQPYGSVQQPSQNQASYPPQGASQSGYGVPPTSQPGYGYGPNYGPPAAQKPPVNPAAYGQTQQSPGTTPGGYSQSAAPPQPGYPHQPALPPSSGYASAAAQPGYGPPYGAPGQQGGYGQGIATYGASYNNPQVGGHPVDGSSNPSARGGYDAPAGAVSAPAAAAQQSGVVKASPKS
ncbi:Far upstream element-binding protein 3 [Linum perenne]